MHMKTRTLALPAVAAAALLSLTGCFQLPGGTTPTNPGTSDPGTDPGTTDPGTDPGTEGEAVDLANTTWSGSAAGVDMEFTFNPDGTIDFIDFGGQGAFDDSADVWSVSGDQLDMSINTEDGLVDFSGTAALGSMSLDSEVGTLSLTQS